MSKPLCRDRLGRNIYQWDVVDSDYGPAYVVGQADETALTIRLRENLGEIRFERCANVEIDLEASLERTNYERYFADLGDKPSIIIASNHVCDEQGLYCDGSCPLITWGYDFDCQGSCLAAFEDWLEQEATL